MREIFMSRTILTAKGGLQGALAGAIEQV